VKKAKGPGRRPLKYPKVTVGVPIERRYRDHLQELATKQDLVLAELIRRAVEKCYPNPYTVNQDF
jgi:hypothetical protein